MRLAPWRNAILTHFLYPLVLFSVITVQSMSWRLGVCKAGTVELIWAVHHKQVRERTQEVQEGLRLLGQAIERVKVSVSDSALISLLESNYDNIRSIKQVMRSLDMQVSCRGGPG